MKTSWTLPPIDRGPKPTDAELNLLANETGRPIRNRAERFFVEVEWRNRKLRDDPDAFLVPFVPDEKDYNKYRKSVAWQKLRAQVIGTARGRCRCCGGTATEVHHRDYRPRVLAGKDKAALIAICGQCHAKIHFSDDGKRRVAWEDNERMLAELVAESCSST